MFFFLFLLHQMEMQRERRVAKHNMHSALCGSCCWHHWALSKLSQLISRILTTEGKAKTSAKHLHVLASLQCLTLVNAFSFHFTAFTFMLLPAMWHVILQKMHASCPSQDGVNCTCCMSGGSGFSMRVRLATESLPVGLVTRIFYFLLHAFLKEIPNFMLMQTFPTKLPLVVSIPDGKSCDFLLLQAFLMECLANLRFYFFYFCQNII